MDATECLVAADALTLHFDAAPHWRIAWREPDWLGPLEFAAHHSGHWYRGGAQPNSDRAHRLTCSRVGFEGSDDLGEFQGIELQWHNLPSPLRTTVRAYRARPLLVFRTEALAVLGEAARSELPTGQFAEPAVVWPQAFPIHRTTNGIPARSRIYGHQYTEFALPVSGDASCSGFFFAPHRPPVVMPLLLIAPDGRNLLLAPLDHFHECVIAVPPDPNRNAGGIRCGWHGDLAHVPQGFATDLAVLAAPSPRQALADWADILLRRHHTKRPSRYADDLVGKLSYWSDNGAVYYYRTEPGCDYATTLERVVTDLHARQVPVRSLQIDSWFYPHQHLRPVSPEGAPIVPPSGMLRWEPREDLFPNGLHDLRRRCGNLPLAFHSRHFWSRSPYFEQYAAWHDGEYAHPTGPELYDRLMAQAASWGAITYEQDWMVESFLGVRGLRVAPGRARAWQEAMDRAAGENGLTLQWCMSTPADFMQSVTLRHLTSIRTSGDYRYLFDNGLNWVWFLHTNALARALGLLPYKDVFLSHGKTDLSDGEPYAEIEALLAALSAGPVGIGDQIGHTDRDLVMRTCREDGLLVKPDVPIAAIDRCFLANSFFQPSLLTGETYSMHPAGRWTYVATFNAYQQKQHLAGRIALADLGAARPTGAVMLYDWRRRVWTRLQPDEGWEVALDFQDWDYRILCPLLPGEVSVFGDVSKYATAGDRRIANIAMEGNTLRFDVHATPGTLVQVLGWSDRRPTAVSAWLPGTQRLLRYEDVGLEEAWHWDPSDGQWCVRAQAGPQGTARVCMSIA